jgi:glycosyltransferase involved in cell wall biosynthesis
VHAVTIPPAELPEVGPRPDAQSRPDISVVVPLFNEAATLRPLYAELCGALDPLGLPWEVVFVDDGSTDRSYAELTYLHAESENVRVVRLRRNFGKAAALTAGFLEASGHTIVTMDADLQDDPAEIPRLLARLDDGFDVVSGWKAERHDPLSRRLFSKVFNGTIRLLSGVRLHDVNCGLKAYRAEVTRDVRIYGELHRFLPVLAHYRGYGVAELPVNHRPRRHGRSRYGIERYLRAFLDLLTVSFIERYRYRPLHLFGNLGLMLAAVGGTILAYLTVLKIGGAGIGQRPLLLLGVLLVVVGIQLLSLGLVGEMLTSQNEARTSAGERLRFYVRDVLD